jgi:surfactin synthase thioesterase subunit
MKEGNSQQSHRYSETPEENIRSLASRIAREGLEVFSEKRFAFIGNSLGSTVAFEVPPPPFLLFFLLLLPR